MVDTVGTAVDTILLRARDAGGIAVPRADVRTYLSHVERLLVWKFDLVRETATYTWPARAPLAAVADLTTTNGNPMARVREIRDLNLALDEVPYRRLWEVPRWVRSSGLPRYWARYGVRLLCVAPAPAHDRPMTVDGNPLFPLFGSDDDALHIRDEWARLAIDWSTALCLGRQRLWDAAAAQTVPVLARLGVPQKAAQ